MTINRIMIDFSGTMIVSISHKDYRLYRDELAFDQLCENMGHVFSGFFSLFLKGREDQILDQLDTVKLSTFS